MATKREWFRSSNGPILNLPRMALNWSIPGRILDTVPSGGRPEIFPSSSEWTIRGTLPDLDWFVSQVSFASNIS